ncbi:MAG TPA: AraC family transcriptional regulator [Methylomirabilota bacterium]|nr:AraC family transcriptional regulator [Methylomirabilota bacterium]
MGPVDGVELFRAWLGRTAYATHRHDTYAVGLTERGVQAFHYRGAARTSLPGDVVVLHPDEPHDGRAGTKDGFGYRIIYVEPALVAESLHALCGRPRALPFVREPVSASARLARAVREAFASPLTPLAVDALVAALTEGLLAAEGAGTLVPSTRRLDAPAVERARRYLDATAPRAVGSADLEAMTGLSRYELARQFRALLGTSPHRYLLMRRLDVARAAMHAGHPLAAVADEAGFADQAHFTRVFKRGVGLTPARYRSLRERRA